MSLCVVIPAAGRGARLGQDLPKILTPLTGTRTVWSVLYDKLAPLADHIQLILSPEGAAQFPPPPAKVSIVQQPDPTGMGDAIFRGQAEWSRFDAILIVWGDQVFVSPETLASTLAARHRARQLVLPVTRMAAPYVEYVFDNGKLTGVRQTREGDSTTPNGFSDVGTFLLATDGLKAAWDDFLATAPRGHGTGEINFLPFLPYLSARGWTVTPVEVTDATEARGINTPDDLAFFRERFKSGT